MPDLESLDALANKLSEVLPLSLCDAKDDLKENFRAILQASFQKLNLVTREEFDVQTALLEKARHKLVDLEARLDAQQKNSDPA